MTEVEYADRAIGHLDSLDPPVADRIMDKVDEAATWPDHRLEPLANWDLYKLRAGDYRAIISWHREADTLVVEAVGHRRNVYDRYLPP